MAFKTQFAGYTPDTDLSISDWVQRLNTNATATVRGVRLTRVGDPVSSNNVAIVYNFSSLITAPGRYVLGIVGEGDTSGIATVELDGALADEIISGTDGDVDVALYAVDVQSFAAGDLQITFNSGARNACGAVVWKLDGKAANAADDDANGAFGSTALIDTTTRTVIAGVAGSTGEAADHFWSGLLRTVAQTLSGTTEQSAAELSKQFTESNLSIGVDLVNDALDGLWVAASWDTPVPELPSGAGALFEKQSSDANTLWSWSAQTLVADAEILALIRPTAESDDAAFGVALRARGPVAAEDSYSFLFYQTSAGSRDQVVIAKTNGSATLTLVGAALSFAWSLNTNYWMRFRVRGTSLQAKIWAEGGSEPAEWMIERTDTDIAASGYAGVWQIFTGTTFLVGHFEVKELAAAWPSTVPEVWSVDISGGPQSNKTAFEPEVGPLIDRRRASAVARNYAVSVPGLTQAQYDAFVEFYHTTLKEGTLPFTYRDPFSTLEKTYKFGAGSPAYEESIDRPVGADYTQGLYRVQFSVTRLD